MQAEALARDLAQLVAGCPGEVTVALRCSDGLAWSWEADRVVPAASTIKVPLLLAVLDESVPLDEELDISQERVGGCGALSLLPSVTTLPVLELLRLMIALSDNDAANVLLDRVGYAAVARLLAKVRTRHTVLARRMMDPVAAQGGRDNVTCASDLVRLFAELRAGRVLAQDRTAVALGILREQQLVDGLPANLPEAVLSGSKTGMLPGLRHDVALFERGERWVALAVTATGLCDNGIDRGTAVLPGFAALGERAAALLG
jgi:beta-lactamase class A